MEEPQSRLQAVRANKYPLVGDTELLHDRRGGEGTGPLAPVQLVHLVISSRVGIGGYPAGVSAWPSRHIRVSKSLAQGLATPSFTANTSTSQTVSVRPGLSTRLRTVISPRNPASGPIAKLPGPCASAFRRN